MCHHFPGNSYLLGDTLLREALCQLSVTLCRISHNQARKLKVLPLCPWQLSEGPNMGSLIDVGPGREGSEWLRKTPFSQRLFEEVKPSENLMEKYPIVPLCEKKALSVLEGISHCVSQWIHFLSPPLFLPLFVPGSPPAFSLQSL